MLYSAAYRSLGVLQIATVTTLPPPSVSTTPPVPQQITTPIPTQPITTDAPTVTTVVPESNALTTVELRVAKLEKDTSELKTVDHSTEALAILKSQVPSVVDNYLGSKRFSESSKKQTLTVDLEQGSEKSASKILQIKREQAEKQQKQKFTIKSIDKAALEEYDLKSALYQSMHANKSFNRDLANHRLYHALIEALIKDENAMDKGVADTVKDHKRKHDDDEDDDDEDPPTGPNQGKKTKRRRTKESESSKKRSSTKETIKGKAPTKGSKTARDDNQPQDTSEPKTRKTMHPDWFKQPPRPLTPDPEWNKRQVVHDQPEQPWFNQMVSAIKDPLTFNDHMATPIDFSNSIELEYNFQECFNALTDKLDWNNPEGDRYPFDLSKPLPLQSRLLNLNYIHFIYTRQRRLVNRSKNLKTWVPTTLEYHNCINNVLKRESSTRVKDVNCGTNLRSLILKRRVEDLQLGVESYQKKLNITKPQKSFPEIKFKELYTPSYDHQEFVLDFRLDYNTEMPKRKWRAVDQKRSGLMIELIDKQLREREIIRNLERSVGARELEIDYKLITRTI
ncbi:hypothetical protein Tco_0452265 [Tanacetum coccineum]